MRVRIESDGEKPALTELQDRLARDPRARALSVTAVSTPSPTMGALDALEIVLGSSGDIANLAVGQAGWRLARAGGRVLGARTLTFGGSTVDVSGLDPQQLADPLRRLETRGANGDAAQS